MNKKTGCYVYAYLRSKSSENGEVGTPYYIGKGNHRRGFYARAFDKRHNIHIPSDKSNVVILADNLADNDSRQAEMLLIHLHGRIDLGTGCLRNLTDGGEGCSGRVVTQYFRNRMSEVHKGKKGVPWTEDRRARMSIRMSGENNPSYGKSYLKSARRPKIDTIESLVDVPVYSKSEPNQIKIERLEETQNRKQDQGPIRAKTGWTHTPESKAKMRAAKVGKILSEEHKLKIKTSCLATFAEKRKNNQEGI